MNIVASRAARQIGWVVGVGLANACLAGTPVEWRDLPAEVQKTVVEHGGKAGMKVDKESETRDGLAIYEAGVKDKNGEVVDLDITADGKLIDTKTDDADDAAAERKARAEKLLAGVKFSHPRDITNPYLPLASLKQDVIDGTEDGKKTHVERTAKPDVHRSFKIGEQDVESLAVEDRAFEDGKLAEVALDFFAQDDNGRVYYLGEEVDEYKDGKIVGHDGSWLTGKDTPVPGVLFVADPHVGDAWRSEDVSAAIEEKDVIESVDETVTVPAGKFEHCVRVKETPSDGDVEYKYYAKGVGVVRETPASGDELLASHQTTR